MSSEVFDCCLQQSLMPTILHRRHLLHTRCLPTQTDVRQKLGKDLADVVFDRMNSVEKCLMGVDKPLKGPPEQMWVDPRDKVKNMIRLTPIPDGDHIKALTHQGIMEIGEGLEKTHETHEKYKIETAVKEAIEFEQFEGKLRMKFYLRKQKQELEKARKLLELKLLEEQQDREESLVKLFEQERNALIEYLHEQNDQKIKETVTLALHKTRERLSKVYERRYCEALHERIKTLKQELKHENEAKGLISISDAKHELKKDVRCELRDETKRKLDSMEVKHVAEVIHIVCAERTNANEKLEDQILSNDERLMRIKALTDQLYHYCHEKCAEFCLVFEELQEEFNQFRLSDAMPCSSIDPCPSLDTQSSQNLMIDTSFPSSLTWLTQNSSQSESCLDNHSTTLFTDLTPHVLMKTIIKHIRRNPKYMQEALNRGESWEKQTIKTALEKIMSFFLNGQNLIECVNKTVDSLSDEESDCAKDLMEKVSLDKKLISTKDSFELIHLPHIPEIPPVNTSKLIQVRDSLDILSHRTSTESSSSDVSVQRKTSPKKIRDTTAYLDFKPKAPKYFSLNLHSDKKQIKVPYKECTDEDIDQLFSEYEASHPNPLEKHRCKSRERKKISNKKSVDNPRICLKDEHYAKKLASLHIRDVLDIITNDE